MKHKISSTPDRREPVKPKSFIGRTISVGWFIIVISTHIWVAEAIPQPQNDYDITDPAIALAVESEIRADDVVPMDPIDISVKNGIVTYDGTVKNLLAKERVTSLAETVKGVRSVVNRIHVMPSQSDSDVAVKERVREEVFHDPIMEGANYNVMVENGKVTLEGTVDSWHQKFLAGEIVKRVQGVKDLDNKLVMTEHQQNKTDADIKQEIVKRLKFDVWVPADALEVNVDQGNVMMTGSLGSAFAKQRAFQLAWTRGVKKVNIEGIEVVPDFQRSLKRSQKPDMSPDEIREAVLEALTYDSRVVDLPTVDVEEGIVTLTGTVDNLQAKRAAEEDARHTVGVWYVRNFLKVRPSKPLNEGEIENLIREAFDRSPFLTKWNISVNVFDEGTAYLTGRVGTFFEKKQAEETAARVQGVTKVLNRLQVNAEWLKKDDAEIRADVKNHLEWSPFVDTEKITVSVEDGLVTLEGAVENWQERQIAMKIAYKGGARNVHNQLRIEKKSEEKLLRQDTK